MKESEFKGVIKPLEEKSRENDDPFFVVSFSREHDRYYGKQIGMDKGDALLVIEDLTRIFNIDPIIYFQYLGIRYGYVNN